jgi:hypothetical protein
MTDNTRSNGPPPVEPRPPAPPAPPPKREVNEDVKIALTVMALFGGIGF